MMYRLWYTLRFRLGHSLKQMRNNVLYGALILLPLCASVLIIVKLFYLVDSWTVFVFPKSLRSHVVPGMGIIILLVVTYVTGAVARNFIGRKVMRFGNLVIKRIPFFNKLYGLLKQIVDAIANPKKKAFNKIVLIEFPHKGSYCLAFLTAKEPRDISQKTGEKMVGVFLPKTPNPTTGFLIYVPESKVIPIDMSMETMLKLVMSGGVVSGEPQEHSEAPQEQFSFALLRRLFRMGRKEYHDPRD